MTIFSPLRPERLELFPCEQPLVRPFMTRAGPVKSLRTILIKITDEEGVSGWGEITPPDTAPCSIDSLAAEALILEKILWPFLCQNAPFDSPEAFDDSLASLPGYMAAKAALSMAAYDITAQKTGIALASLIGAEITAIPLCRRLSPPTLLPSLVAEAEQMAADGLHSINLVLSPGADLAPALALRRALPSLDLRLDARAAYTTSPDSMRLFYALDALDLSGIQQPFADDDLVDHARLQAAIRTPLILDQSVQRLHTFEQAATLHSGRLLNIKFRQAGSLTATRRLIAAAQKQGWGLLADSQLEGFFGFQIAMAFAQHPAMILPADFLESAYKVKDFDLFWRQEPFHKNKGMIHFHPAMTALADFLDLSRLLPRQKQAKSLKKAA